MTRSHTVVAALACAALIVQAAPAAANGVHRKLPREERPLLLTLGVAGAVEHDLRGNFGPAITLSYNVGPHLSFEVLAQLGYADGPLLSPLEGWSGGAQAGVKWLWFEGLFSPYVGACFGFEYLSYRPPEVGGLFAPSTEEEAIREAEQQGGFGLRVAGLIGIDFAFRSGFAFGIEVQVGYVNRRDPDDSGLVIQPHHWIGYRF